MKFKNKKNNKVVEAKSFAELFAFINNTEWEKINETSQEPTVKELKAKLTEMGIAFDSKAKKEDLIALLENNEDENETSQETTE